VEVFFVAERIGDAYRGEALDAKTYQTVLRTAHTYQNETIAKVAARRTWEAKQQALAVQA